MLGNAAKLERVGRLRPIGQRSPAAALDAFGAEVAEMRDRTAERRAAEPQEGREHFAC